MLISVLDQSLEKSPYFSAAHEAGAKAYIVLNHMFMPYQYGDQLEEYWALINDVTLWDVAAERQVEIAGRDAAAFVDLLVPRNLEKLKPGQCRYVLVTDQDGAIVNDPVLNRLETDRYWFSAADSDLLLWAKGVACFAGMDVSIRQPDIAPIQIQGGKSRDVVIALFGERVLDLRYYHLVQTELDGMQVVLTRTGWSGDLGYEIYLCDTARARDLWDRVLAAGKPFNMRVTGPNTIRRVEAGIMAMRSDFPDGTTPFHLGLERLVDLDKPVPFIGKEALRQIAKDGVSWRLVGIEVEVGPMEAREYSRMSVFHGNKAVGQTSVVVFSPRLGKAIGYARVESCCSTEGTMLQIDGPQGSKKAKVVPRPFFDASKSIARQ